MIESAEEFMRLRASDNQEEYHRAAHESAPIEVWKAVVEDYPDMAFWVAQNKTVPYEILELLASHEDDGVRTMVARKNKLKEALLLKLAADPSDTVRLGVARHKNASLAVLKKLMEDSWPEISKLALGRAERGSHK